MARRLAACVVLLGLTIPALAAADDEGQGKPWTLTAGIFMPWHGDLCGIPVDNGYSIALSKRLSQTPTNMVLGNLRFTRFELENDQYVELISPTIEYRLTSAKPVYLAVAGGFVVGKNRGGVGGGNTWSAAFELGAGWNVTDTVVLEARMLRGSKRGEHGFVISAGIRL